MLKDKETFTRDEVTNILNGHRRSIKDSISKFLTMLLLNQDRATEVMQENIVTQNDTFVILSNHLINDDDAVDKDLFTGIDAAIGVIAAIDDGLRLADAHIKDALGFNLSEPTSYKTFVSMPAEKVTPESSQALRSIVMAVIDKGVMQGGENDWEYSATKEGDNYMIVVKNMIDEDIQIKAIKDETDNISTLIKHLQSKKNATIQ